MAYFKDLTSILQVGKLMVYLMTVKVLVIIWWMVFSVLHIFKFIIVGSKIFFLLYLLGTMLIVINPSGSAMTDWLASLQNNSWKNIASILVLFKNKTFYSGPLVTYLELDLFWITTLSFYFNLLQIDDWVKFF